MNSGNKLACFKVYDVRGKLGEELDEGIAYRIARATFNHKRQKPLSLDLMLGRHHPIWLVLWRKVFAMLVLTS